MTQTRPYQGSNYQGIEQRIQQPYGYLLSFEKIFKNVIPYGKGNDKKQTVIPDLDPSQ